MLKSVDKKPRNQASSGTPNKAEKQVRVQSEFGIKPLPADEVSLTLEIKEIRYGRRQINAPEVTTLINNTKVVNPVPFETPLRYSFRRTEDDMIFKFAVTSAGDLLGFIYMEIPLKFKTIKKFKLDDWFPVKMVQTQDQEKLKAENFVARVIINYESTRKLEANALNLTPKTLKTQLAEDTSKNLKQKIDNIHEEVDAFGGEGFKHLEEFHRKLLHKKIKSTTALIENTKKQSQSRSKSPNKLINDQKETFYRAQQTLGQTDEVKNDQLQVKHMFNRSANTSPDTVVARKTNSCMNCENLIKELSYTRKELIEANQKITAMEEKQMSVDNVKLKKQLEALQDSLNKDRKELSIKLKDHAVILEQERARLSKVASDENAKAYALQKDANSAIAECKARISEVKGQEADLERRQTDFEARLDLLTKNENDYIQKLKSFLKERDEYLRDKEEWEEIKARMIKERRRIHEEASKYHFLRSDLNLKKEELQALDDYFGEEKNKFKADMDNKIGQIEQLKYELVKKQEIFDMEQRHFEEQKKLLEDKNLRLTNEMRQVKTEAAKLSQMRSKLLKEGEQLAQAKDSVNTDHQLIFEEIEKDYQFLDTQLRVIEEQKAEMANMQEMLGQYEKTLEAQNKVHQEQQARLGLFSKQLIQKLNVADYDQEEVKKMVEAFAAEYREWEQKYYENQRVTRELDKGRTSIRKSMAVILEKSSKAINLPERTSIMEKRKTKRFQEGIKVERSFEDEFRLARELDANGEAGGWSKDQEKIQELQAIIKSQQQKISDLEHGQGAFKPFGAARLSAQGAADLDPVETARLQEIQAELDRIFAQKIQTFKSSQPNRANPQKYEGRVRSIENAQRIMHNVMTVLAHVNNLKLENLAFDGGLFDHEKLVAQYEKKIADLIEFIQRVKDNTDFFNNNMDNEILIR